MRPLIKTILLVIAGPGTVTVLVPYLVLGSGWRWPFEAGYLRFIGLLPVAAGAVLYVWAALTFALVGKGTPAPIDPPRFLVATGPFRVNRNPMYTGLVTQVLGEGLLFQSLGLMVYASLLWLMFNTFVLLYEERHLKKKFGAPYLEYMGSVGRWIPRRRGST